MTEPDATVKENAQDTIRETPEQPQADSTLVYAGISSATHAAINNFRGWQITEQLPTKGAEADIFIVNAAGERRVLKLYRHRLEPKIEILNRITAISRANSHCFVTYFETGFDETTGRWYELQEFIQNGSVKDLPRDVKREQNFIAQFIPELATAIQCLHDNGIIHCDIKPANVLVRNLEPLDLVLADFGISSLVASDMSRKMTSLKGTPMYWAPEAFSKTVSRASDWWGLGIMLLEMLAGEHPFDGMNDSEIIRELTLGNVEIPSSIGDDFGLLVRGLLTKDDTKRWGKGEIDRWLAGARDIPVHYESSKTSARDKVKPFVFSNGTYRTAREIATAFAYSEEPWESPADYLRYIRHWYESNLMFDEAERHGKACEDTDPELALFRFVHSNEELPFAIFGHRTDAEGLCVILRRAAYGYVPPAEKNLLKKLNDDKLRDFYGEYGLLREADPSYGELLKFIARRDRADQIIYADAFRDPGAYIWPDDLEIKNGADAMSFMAKLSDPPCSRADMERVTSEHTLPDSLTAMFSSSKTYADGARRLKKWLNLGMLLPHSDDVGARAMSADEYEQAVRIRIFRHTDATLARLSGLSEKISGLNDDERNPILGEILKRLGQLRDMRVPESDESHINELSELLAARRKIIRSPFAFATVRWLSAPVTFWAAQKFLISSGRADTLFFGAIALLMTVIFLLYTTAVENGLLADPSGETASAIAAGCGPRLLMGCAIIILITMATPSGVMRLLSELLRQFHEWLSAFFPFAGMMLLAPIIDSSYKKHLKRSENSIIEACRQYNLEIPQPNK